MILAVTLTFDEEVIDGDAVACAGAVMVFDGAACFVAGGGIVRGVIVVCLSLSGQNDNGV